MTRSSALALGSALALFLVVSGCSPSAPSIPPTPDGTFTTVCKSLANGQPDVLWAALPASYQKQLQEDVVRAFAAKLDPEMYGKGVAVAKKLVGLLKQKRDLILPMVTENPMFQAAKVEKAKVAQNWDKVTGLLETVLTSELGDVARLKSVDIGAFLRGTGGRLMRQAAELSALSADDPYKKEFQAKMSGVKAEVVKAEGDKATVKVSTTGEREETMEFVKVEGKWLPQDMVQGWDRFITDAKAKVAEMKPDAMAAMKPQVMGTLAGFDAALDQVAAAKTSEELVKAMGGIMGQMPFFMGGVGESE